MDAKDLKRGKVVYYAHQFLVGDGTRYPFVVKVKITEKDKEGNWHGDVIEEMWDPTKDLWGSGIGDDDPNAFHETFEGALHHTLKDAMDHRHRVIKAFIFKDY